VEQQQRIPEFITKPVDFDFLKTQLRDLCEAAD
jgi:hypothetical protein